MLGVAVLLLAWALRPLAIAAKWRILTSGDKEDRGFTRAASAFSETTIYTFGGEFEGQYSGNLNSFRPGQKRWTRVLTAGSMPSHRAGATLTKISSSLYLIGGHNELGTLASIHKFDTITSKWHKVFIAEDFKFTARSGHAACTDGQNRIFLFGGYNDDGLFLNDLYEISISSKSNPQSNAKQIIAKFKLLSKDSEAGELNPSPKEYASMQLVDGKLYLFGGYTYGGSSGDGMWTFDLAEAKWTRVESALAPPPCEGMSSVTLGRSILFFGGCDFSYNSSRCFDDLWRYDTVDKRWSIIPVADVKPTARAFAAIAFINNVLVVHGGSKMDKRVFPETYKLVEMVPCRDPAHTCLARGKCMSTSCVCQAGYGGHDCSITLVAEEDQKSADVPYYTEM